MAGLVPAIHAAPLQRPVQQEHGSLQRATAVKRFVSAACLRALHAPNHVDGRDKPGHDALRPGPDFFDKRHFDKRHQQILDFQKNSSLMIWSPERWFITPWSLLFASPIVTRTLTAGDPRTAIRGHVRQLHIPGANSTASS